jgi:O-6-methylguanine DNA methyltransferase
MSAPAPLGLLFLARTEHGLRYLEFMDRKSIRRMIARHEADNPDATWEASLLELKPVVDQLESYFCGTLTEFTVPVDAVGSEFQLSVWRALCRIPYAHTASYGEIAKRLGRPRAARAVGLANHDNPIALIIPCHRVVGADGSMVGYGGGLPRKKWLLQHEARFGRLEDQLDLRPTAASSSTARVERESAGLGRAATPPRATRPRGAASARAGTRRGGR